MKEYKYLYRKMLEDKTIRGAYKKLRKNKTKRKEIIYIDAHLDEEVEKMRLMILNTKPEEVKVPNPELRYIPPERKTKIIFEHGKERKIYMPEIHEQWLHHIIIQILAPIIMATAYRFSCGSFPKRGAHYGKRQIERWLEKNPKGMRYFLKIDIRHFYNNVRIDILLRELEIRIKDEWFLYIIRVCLTGSKKGIPLGFYISQWLANYMLEPLDKAILAEYGMFQRYMDDITIFSSAKKKLHVTLIMIKKILGRRFRLKLKHNYQICKLYYEGKRIMGRPLDFMGFVFYRNKTIIRKNILLSAVRLAHKMKKTKIQGRGYYHKHITAMLSYMGWFTCTNTYDAYKEYIKPYICIKKLKKIISKLRRRQNEHETVENRDMRYAARGNTAYCARIINTAS